MILQIGNYKVASTGQTRTFKNCIIVWALFKLGMLWSMVCYDGPCDIISYRSEAPSSTPSVYV